MRADPERARRASLPFLPQVGTAYGQSHRLLIVGKVASLSWEDFEPEDELAREDEKLLARIQDSWGSFFERPDGSPFWRGCAKVAAAAGGSLASVAWTNVLKLGGRGPPHTSSWNPDHGVRRLQVRAGVLDMLRVEIEELQPDTVLFVTGPAFDDYLRKAFPGWRLKEEAWPQALAQMVGEEQQVIRSRHFQGMTNATLDRICDDVRRARSR